jgi:hypothetical protein
VCSGVTWWHGAPVSSSPRAEVSTARQRFWDHVLLETVLAQRWMLNSACIAGLYKYATTCADICLEVLVYNVHVGNGETGRQ